MLYVILGIYFIIDIIFLWIILIAACDCSSIISTAVLYLIVCL